MVHAPGYVENYHITPTEENYSFAKRVQTSWE